MKMRICVTVEIDDERRKYMVAHAKMSGHNWDKCENDRILIRRFLEAGVRDAVTYAKEQTSLDGDEA